MCIIKFSTQQHNGIYDMTNNLKVIISVRGGNLLFLQCLFQYHAVNCIFWSHKTCFHRFLLYCVKSEVLFKCTPSGESMTTEKLFFSLCL